MRLVSTSRSSIRYSVAEVQRPPYYGRMILSLLFSLLLKAFPLAQNPGVRIEENI